jgi:hypothetical protein
VRLANVAEIVDRHRETSGFLHMNGQSACRMGARRQAGANVVDLIAVIDEEIERINHDFGVRNLDVRLGPVYKETRGHLELRHGGDYVGQSAQITSCRNSALDSRSSRPAGMAPRRCANSSRATCTSACWPTTRSRIAAGGPGAG